MLGTTCKVKQSKSEEATAGNMNSIHKRGIVTWYLQLGWTQVMCYKKKHKGKRNKR